MTRPDSATAVATAAASAAVPASRVRYFILFLLFTGVSINYLDRTIVSVAAPLIQQELSIDPVWMGVIFSAFGWSYMAMQLPSGILIDRFGAKRTFSWSLTLWSLCTMLFGVAGSSLQLMLLRLGLGATEAPCFPSAQRVVASWFPRKERGRAVSTYVSGQFMGLAFFAPLLAWAVTVIGWKLVFVLCGALGLVFALVWIKYYREPDQCTQVNDAERAFIFDDHALPRSQQQPFKWATVGALFKKREMWGVYVAKFSLSSTLFFFFTWFPNYLVHEKGMGLIKAGLFASVPFIAAMLGMIFGGNWSDWMSQRNISHTLARKLPVIIGMLLCSLLFIANYLTEPLAVISILSVAFFGQGMAGGLDAIVVDMAPSQGTATTVGLCQFCANLGGALTPLVIGMIIQATGSYIGGLIYVSALAMLGVFAVLVMIRRVERITL
jgi:ACS family D-galactonate transporter-like MFS transporter